jgi:DNA-binding beta-propeller fold protein YncE
MPFPLPVPTPIATGVGSLNGSAYRRTTDQLLILDDGAGAILALNTHTHAWTTLGTGYNMPNDIVLSADGVHAYVTESPGTLLRVNLGAANRSNATVISSGLSQANQIALDEAHQCAYVAEFGSARIQRVSLVDGSRQPVGQALPNQGRGALLTGDARFLYAGDDSGNITRFDLLNNTSTVVGKTSPFGAGHLLWADAGESVILLPLSNDTVCMVDLTTAHPAAAAITTPPPFGPHSLAIPYPGKLLIVSAATVSQVDLTPFSAAGPILLGIGFVPADLTHLPAGYADTSMDGNYFFQVHDCPFGGTLPLMINWEHARGMSANYYQVFITGPSGPPVQVTQPFSDYLWSVPLNRFELVTTAPTGGYYPLRAAGQIWLNYWLGLLLDTTGRPNDLNTISIKLFASQSAASEIGHSTDAGRFAAVMIDNTVPTANLEAILHAGVVLKTCDIVTTPPHTFSFRVTASAPRHLRGWSLAAYWGDNASTTVTGDDYSHHPTSRIWTGLASTVVPAAPWDAYVTGDATSIHCAHTFFLYAWDRVINGWGYIHGTASYHKSITLGF